MDAASRFVALTRLDLPFYEYAGEFCKLAAATAWEDATLNKLFWLGANHHRPVDLPDTTGLTWREGIFRCLGSVRARARTSLPLENMASSMIIEPRKCPPVPAPRQRPQVPAPAERPQVPAPAERPQVPAPAERPQVPAPAERPQEPAPAERPQEPAPAERPQESVLPERTQESMPPVRPQVPDGAPIFPKEILGGG